MGQPDQRAEGAGPFTTRLTWHPPGGGTAVWESRPARRRGRLRAPELARRTAEDLGIRPGEPGRTCR
ncbi:hypothetical protein ABZX29_35050, partial [Streptomyces zhihengii]